MRASRGVSATAGLSSFEFRQVCIFTYFYNTKYSTICSVEILSLSRENLIAMQQLNADADGGTIFDRCRPAAVRRRTTSAICHPSAVNDDANC